MEGDFYILESSMNKKTIEYETLESQLNFKPPEPEAISQKAFITFAKEEMEYLGVTREILANQLGMSMHRTSEIFNCKGRKITDWEKEKISKKLNFIY
jgi:hypothetical protein